MFTKVISHKTFIYILLLTALLSVQLQAGTTGKISGRVIDAKTREPLIGATVVLVGTKMGAASDADGNYFILNIPPGTYTLKATAIGYASTTITNIKVSVDITTKVDVTMGEQAIELSNVVVTASRPLVQKDLTSTEASVSGQQISMLPLEDVQAVINLQAGVVDGHVRGGRMDEVKYMLDGVSVNDAFSGDYSMLAEVNSIAEVQVITGTFNAEYGEALSGVVNQVTKLAGDSITGEFQVYSGDYFTTRRNQFGQRLYNNLNKINPENVYNFQGNISGPVPFTKGFMKYFFAGRYLNDDGYLYGQRIFNPSDSSNFTANNPQDWYVGATGDRKYVSMNYNRRLSLQGKISFDIGNGKGLIFEGMLQNREYKDYNHAFVLNPDGDYRKFQYSRLGSVTYNHVFGQRTFIDVIGSVFSTQAKQYVYANPLDPRYVNPDRLRDAGANSFLTGGTENWHLQHTTTTSTGKVDLTSQILTAVQIKSGIEANFHRLSYEDFQIHVDATTGFKPALPAPGNFDFNTYLVHPYQLAYYIQSKIELEYLIVNLGIRFDYFQPDASYLINPDQIAELDTLKPPFPSRYFKKASAKNQISPRLGISYPISDRGAIHISYGHFFQIPPFDFLYRNPNYRIPLVGDLPDFVGNVIGNPDLEPQRTTIYEIGLQQGLTDEISLTLTAYYKDIRNLLGTEIHIKNEFKKFAKYINTDYGAVNGFIISFDKRFSQGFSATVDYTFQIAKGNASDPNEAFNKAQSSPPVEVNKQLVFLNWDRRHSLNFTVTGGVPGNFIGSLIGRLGTGLPYTPALQNQRTGLENSDTRPPVFNVDLYLTKYLQLMGRGLSVFLKVYNLFDTANELNVFTDTGRAGYTLDLTRQQAAPRGVNTLQEYYTRPDFYSAPRQVILGASLNF
ncbi:MAG TPA: TonB-dependent receptor [Ignavibacteriales bacterium]|nr:TonB-dependent receptor [Ignavibacteriales bacterium]